MPRCRDCGAEVRWATTPKGKKIMLELDPEPWSLGKKLWHIEPGVDGLDGAPLSQLDIEQAGGDIEGYAVHWDVCGDEARDETPLQQKHSEKTQERVQEDQAVLAPDKHGNRYGSLYGREKDQPIQDRLFAGLDAPPAEDRPSGRLRRARGLIKTWREMADTYDQEGAGVDKIAVAKNLRLNARELEDAIG